jgi:cytochrome b6-f complex iron-sulfur subunit/menaquinol-cytochrome c reductase iron-sulfur subunit
MSSGDQPPKPTPESIADAPDSPERRRFLSTATVALGACAGGLVLLPAAGAVLAPLGRRTVRLSTEADVGDEADFKEGEPRRVIIRGTAIDAWQVADRELGAAWVTKYSGRWVAFSATCPHLGCAVDYVGAGDAPYFCPCHSSSFAADGAPLKGPSPRGLDELPVTVVDGRVRVEFHQYVLNKSQKVES